MQMFLYIHVFQEVLKFLICAITNYSYDIVEQNLKVILNKKIQNC